MEQLRQQCLEEKVDKHAEAVKAYSALTQSPKEWSQEVGPRPSPHVSAQRTCMTGLSMCSGDDRWQDWADVALHITACRLQLMR